MTAARVKLVIEVGATFRKTIACYNADGSPMSFVGISPVMQIRQRLSDPDPLLTLNLANGRIEAVPGALMLWIGADVTDTISAKKGVYDLELHTIADASEVVRLIEGDVEFRPAVTRG
jgi:hypothetical protein